MGSMLEDPHKFEWVTFNLFKSLLHSQRGQIKFNWITMSILIIKILILCKIYVFEYETAVALSLLFWHDCLFY